MLTIFDYFVALCLQIPCDYLHFAVQSQPLVPLGDQQKLKKREKQHLRLHYIVEKSDQHA